MMTNDMCIECKKEIYKQYIVRKETVRSIDGVYNDIFWGYGVEPSKKIQKLSFH